MRFMLLIRPAALDDLDAIESLAVEAGPGMTNLPPKRDLLREKIRQSLETVAAETASVPGGGYFFVAEDRIDGRIVGCCGILTGVGIDRPFYSFRVTCLTHSSQELGEYEPVEVLQMVEEYRGSTEIATLFLLPEARRDGNGKHLSRSRFLYMAEFPHRFAGRVMAEMRGMQDERGHSCFWDNLGRKFIHMDFSKADYLSSLGRYQFIADMMPKFPIYLRLLPAEVQAVIGKTHEATGPALALLEREGFRFEGCIDVFDAGPTVHCPLDQIRTVRDSERLLVERVRDSATADGGEHMVCNTRQQDFRLTRASIARPEPGVTELDRPTAKLLGVSAGDHVRAVAF
jgi:arginine N-succinyltransferase